MKTSEKLENIAKAMCALQGEITNVPANSTNPFYHSKYADLASIINASRPLLVKHGLTIIQGACDNKLETRILHTSGEWMETAIHLAVPNKSNPQDLGAAVTYARRYSLAAILNIAQEDDDGNSLAKEAKRETKQEATPKPTIHSLVERFKIGCEHIANNTEMDYNQVRTNVLEGTDLLDIHTDDWSHDGATFAVDAITAYYQEVLGKAGSA